MGVVSSMMAGENNNKNNKQNYYNKDEVIMAYHVANAVFGELYLSFDYDLSLHRPGICFVHV